MAAFGSRLVVVLDEMHAVTNEECLASIDYALEHLPPNVRVVTATRADPALRLAHLRAGRAGRGPCERARTDAGRSSRAPREQEPAEDRYRGGRGPRRAHRGLARRPRAGRTLAQDARRPYFGRAEVRGDNRFVADYLSGEVLSSTTASGRSSTALPSWVSSPGSSATPCSSAPTRWSNWRSWRLNLFVTRLERGGWYRIHSLLAEHAKPSSPYKIRASRRGSRADRCVVQSAGSAVRSRPVRRRGGDHELVADVLVEYHLALVSNGASRTLLSWIRTLPEDVVVEHSELTVAAAIASMLHGSGSIERHRYLQLADRARERLSGEADIYVEGFSLIARTMMLDDGVSQAVLDGRRALEIAPVGWDALVNGAQDVYARALFFAGDLEGPAMPLSRFSRTRQWRAHAGPGGRAHDPFPRRPRAWTPRRRQEPCREGEGRSWPNRQWAQLARCERKRCARRGVGGGGRPRPRRAGALDGPPFLPRRGGDGARVRLLVLLARVRVRRGRLLEAEQALQTARETGRPRDSGRVPEMAVEVEHELAAATDRARGGELLEPPTEAELKVLRLLGGDLSTREIGSISRRAPSTRTSTRSTESSGCTLGAGGRAGGSPRSAAAIGITWLNDPVPASPAANCATV